MVRNYFLFSLLFFSISLIGQSEEYEKQMNHLFDKGYEHLNSDKDSTIFYFEKIYALAVLQKDWKSVADALTGKNWLAEYLNDFQSLKQNLKALDSLFIAQKSYFESLPEYELYNNDLFYHKGQYFFLIDDFESARNEFNKIIELNINPMDSEYVIEKLEFISTAYSYLAKMYADEGKLNLANTYYERNIRFLKYNLPNNKKALYHNYDLIAEVLKKKKQYKKANSYLLKNLDYTEENSVPKILNIVQNHNNLSQIDSAEFYLKIVKNILPENAPNLSSYYQVSAETKQKNGEYHKALKDFNKALEIEQNRWKNKKNYKIAHIWNKIGLLQSAFDKKPEALISYNHALTQLNGLNSPVHQRKSIEILKNKTQVLNRLKTKNNYLAAIESVNLGTTLLDSLKPTFKNHTDKLLLIEDAFPLFESGIEASYALYKAEKDEKYIDQAFLYSEKSKSVLLIEALLASKATEFANIPKDLLENEKQLKGQITNFEKQLNTGEANSKLQDQLFNLKKDYQSLINTIETEYPTYYDLKYSSTVISILEAQQLVANDEVLISYFYGNNAIYAISLSRNTKDMYMIPIDNMDVTVKEVHKMLSNPKSDISVLAQKTNKLYKLVLAPVLDSFEKKKVTIISDGLLNYIPFGALNISENNVSYLTESKSLAYSNSVTLLQRLRNRPITNQNILAFAPSFENTSLDDEKSKTLLSLPHNTREVKQIMDSFEGNPFFGKNATLKNFKSKMSDFGIIHLATHAISNDNTPEYSYLAFAPKENEDYLLYVRDLYNMQLNADLVTLSACETGVGELKKGEGFIGLARGFFYSGVSSIASTLWKVNDASSTRLMDLFYKNLAKGNTKDVALKNAKREFLDINAQNALVHPYYWSGFIISGNTAPLRTATEWKYWAVATLFLIVFGAWAYQKKNRPSGPYSNS